MALEITEEERFKNKQLVKEYPFLFPRNRWTDKVDEDYNYEYTELDAMPEGWRKAFGEKLCKELKDELVRVDYLYKYRISQIKEKYGTLRWYDFGNTKEGYEILRKYEDLSARTCIQCGKPATRITTGWIAPYCDDCIDDALEYSVPISEFYDEK